MAQFERDVQSGLTIPSGYLDGLAVFLAVATQGGFRSAARQLGLTPSAVSQSIRTLEARLGAPLFSRTTRSVGLTEAGQRLVAHVAPAIEMVTTGLDEASGLGGEISGRLRINAPRPALPLLFNRLLPEFLTLYPKVQLELVGEDRMVDIVSEGFDAGIRFGHLVAADMVATRLTPADRYVVVGTPAFFREHGRPQRPEELQHFACIDYRRVVGASEPWRFVVGKQTIAVHVEGRLTTNDVEGCIRAVLRGVGLFMFPRSLVMHYLERKQMQSVLERYTLTLPGLSLYYPSRNQSLPKLRAFVGLAKAKLRQPHAAEDFLPMPSAQPLRRTAPRAGK